MNELFKIENKDLITFELRKVDGGIFLLNLFFLNREPRVQFREPSTMVQRVPKGRLVRVG